MNAIILHGLPGKSEYFSEDRPSPSNSHWLPWLQAQLLRKGITAQTPEMPRAWWPNYQDWRSEFEGQCIGEDTLLIGHSLGCGFIVQWLSDRKDVSVGDVFLVAPSLGDVFFPEIMPRYEHPLEGGFGDFTVDPGIVQRCRSITIINSTDDRERVQKSVEHLRGVLGEIDYAEFADYGHFTSSNSHIADGHFPELMKIIEDRIGTIASR